MRFKSSLFLLLVAVLVSAFYVSAPARFPSLADGLVFQNIDGQQQHFADLRGKPLLVTFWSPSCVICMHEVPDLNQLYQVHRGGEAFELLGLTMSYDRPDVILQTRQRAGMQYPVYLDLHNELASAFGDVTATPTSFLIDADGEIVYRHSGKLDFTLLNDKLKKLIG